MHENIFLAVITARGGSKEIKNKNILELNGIPLITYTINATKNLSNVTTIVSTDSRLIAQISEDAGALVPFVRPPYLATDSAKSFDVIMHALDFMRDETKKQYDAVITLQPTSPLRNAQDMNNAINLYNQYSPESLISVYEETDINYTKIYRSTNDWGTPLFPQMMRRQELERTYIRNGAIYITRTDYLEESSRLVSEYPLMYVMSRERSIDLNTKADLKHLKKYISEKKVTS